MGAFSIWHWLIVIIAWVVWIVPLYRILGRVALPKGLAFLALFPPLGLIILWVIAFSGWGIADAYEEPAMGDRS